MYTEFHFNIELAKGTPQAVLDVLDWMANGDRSESRPPDKPEHAFFDCDRWAHLFWMDSYYFPAKSHTQYFYDDIAKQHFLCVRSNLKNYCNEILLFVDWIAPYIDPDLDGEMIGFYRYENSNSPTILYHRREPYVVPEPKEPRP